MIKILIAGTFILCACNSSRVGQSGLVASPGISINGKLFATVFQQKSAEYRALCLQSYNIARFRLDQYQPQTNKPAAIITDIDETVLDNSPYEAHQTLQGKDYEPASWFAWTDKSAADTIAGAASFLKYAAAKGVEVFYITNREERERATTINNLKRFSLPNADNEHLLSKQTSSGKEPRRQTVATSHEIIMLIGDNLADFSNLFDKKAMGERFANTDLSSGEFGKRFIIIPNSVYGDWESSLFKFNKLTQQQKDSVIRSEVKTY